MRGGLGLGTAARKGSPPWTPASDARILAWFDPTIVVGGAAASSWVSRVGAVSAAQGTAGSRPAISATGLNGGPCLDFDGGDNMAVSGLSAVAGNVLLVASVDIDTLTGYRAIMDAQTGRLLIDSSSIDVANRMAWYDGAWKNSGAVPTGGAQVLAYDLRSAPGGRVFRNGVQVGSTTTYTQRALGGTIRIGSDYNGTAAFFDGRMGHLIIAVNQDDALRAKIEAFIASRSGL